MEKRRPHYKLLMIQTLLEEGKVRVTHSARVGALLLGLSLTEMLKIVEMLLPKDFYKSMTTHLDHTIWQDVYCPQSKIGALYIKLTLTENVLIVSFKEK